MSNHLALVQWILRRLFLAVAVLLIVGCARREPLPSRPTATPYMTPTPSITPFKSPDGVSRGQTICWISGIYTTCVIELANGQKIRGAIREWSQDGRYAIACMGATHDSPCWGSEVWDMVSGTKLTTVYPANCYAWSPTEPNLLGYVLYYQQQFEGENEAEMYIIDITTGSQVRQTTYPDWYRAKWANLTVYTTCLAPLDRIVGSDERGFVGPNLD